MSFLDDLLGKTSDSVSNAAAADTYGKQRAATATLRADGSNYATGMDALSQKFQPYVDAGGDALKRLLGGLGLGGGGEDFTAAYRATPGYQAGLDTGGRVTAANANSGNMLQSGKTLKSLQRFGSDYEDQKSGNYIQQLLGLSGQGQQATGQQVQTAGQGLTGQLSADTTAYGGDMTAAGTIGQGQVAGAQARQTALTNLMNTGAYLGGAALGGGFGRTSSFIPTPTKLTPWGGGGMYDQGPVR